MIICGKNHIFMPIIIAYLTFGKNRIMFEQTFSQKYVTKNKTAIRRYKKIKQG